MRKYRLKYSWSVGAFSFISICRMTVQYSKTIQHEIRFLDQKCIWIRETREDEMWSGQRKKKNCSRANKTRQMRLVSGIEINQILIGFWKLYSLCASVLDWLPYNRSRKLCQTAMLKHWVHGQAWYWLPLEMWFSHDDINYITFSISSLKNKCIYVG